MTRPHKKKKRKTWAIHRFFQEDVRLTFPSNCLRELVLVRNLLVLLQLRIFHHQPLRVDARRTELSCVHQSLIHGAIFNAIDAV